MSYRAGIGPGLQVLGLTPGLPHVRCDADGCDRVQLAETRSGGPAAWLLNRKAPPGWRLIRREAPDGDVFRRDYCPDHHAEWAAEKMKAPAPGPTKGGAP